jgi:hypothetical protein
MDEIAEIIAARRTEIEAEFRETWAAIPMAKTVYTAALRAHEDAQARYNTVVARIDRAANHTDPLSAVLRELLATERERYNEAGAALTKAKRHVADLEWIAECRRGDLEQLDRFVDPPKSSAYLEVVKRPPAPAPEDLDTIVMPATPRVA